MQANVEAEYERLHRGLMLPPGAKKHRDTENGGEEDEFSTERVKGSIVIVDDIHRAC